MISFTLINVFILTIFSFLDLGNAAPVCDGNDTECTRNRAKEAYSLFVGGIDNIVGSSDPLTKDLIKASLPTVKYEFRNAKLSGFKNCDVTLMSVYKANSSFEFHLYCPKIEVDADYTLLGEINGIFVQGEGKFLVNADKYKIKFNGIYEKTTGKDNKEHIHIKNYFLDVDLQGGVQFNVGNLFGGDKEKGDAFNAYLNKNWKEMDKALRAPALNSMMDIFIENLNKFLQALPVDQIFPELAME